MTGLARGSINPGLSLTGGTVHHGHHQLVFVIFSIFVAVLGSWTALDLQRQVRAHGGRIRLYWLSATAVAMGLSIFSMHFIAMLGFDAGLPVRYDLLLTLLSLLLAIIGTSFAFIATQAREATRLRLSMAALAMGCAITSMHYVGMAAIRAPLVVTWDPWLVAGSFLIAVAVSGAALAAALARPGPELRLLGAVVLGLAVCSMHYTGMAAASFEATPGAASEAGGLDQLSLALWVGTGTMGLLFLVLMSAMFDRRFEAMALREAVGVAAREAHLRELLMRMPLAVVVVPRGGGDRISFANALAEELLGSIHPADLAFLDLDGRLLPAGEHPYCRAIATGAEQAGVVVGLKREEGRLRYLEVSAALLASPSGSAEEVILTAHDVTARLEAEQTLHQTQKLETIGQLTGGVAHDFNNLLTPIVGGLDLLRRDATLAPRARRIVDAALQASNKAATLVQRLLAFSRRQILQPTLVEMGTILNGLHDLIVRSIGPTVRVSIEAQPDLVVRIDPDQFELAILNLAVNARDAMPDGGELSITAAAEELYDGHPSGLPAGRYVRIGVKDSGVGMDEGTIRRAVEPFFSTKGPGKGTGLGLSMVHGLAAQSQGALRLSSQPGHGTQAELWLPLSTERPAAADPAMAAPLREAEAATILLVDDELLVRSATGEMLRAIGYDVIEAESGADALRCLEANPDIALIVTDHLMPGMSGVALAREATALRPDLPVLIVTAYTMPQDLPPELPKLRKPFLAEQLDEAVRVLLAPRRDNVVAMTGRSRGP